MDCRLTLSIVSLERNEVWIATIIWENPEHLSQVKGARDLPEGSVVKTVLPVKG